jgi:hypothetical protein
MFLFRAYRETAVLTPNRYSIRRSSTFVLAALALSVFGGMQPASAQGLFDTLFGGFHRRQALPQHSNSYADPYGSPDGESRRSSGETSGSYGHGTAFCVRTCDGRYFPIQRQAGASPVEICRSFCPAAKTMVFTGSKIDGAVAQNGTRYADLDSAFAYRNSLVANCTCNGKDGLGLARMEATGDPTLRPGDIVATNNGLATYNAKSAEFTPINPASGEWARRLAEVKVRPAPPQQKIDVSAAAQDDVKSTKRTRRAAR